MKIKPFGFLAGLAVFIVILWLPAPDSFLASAQGAVGSHHELGMPATQLAHSMKSVLAVLGLMVLWWVTEAVPLPATALLPAVLFPLLQVTGVQQGIAYPFSAKNTLLNYANPVIYLFLGGFLIAGAMRKWRLDRRLTLWFLTRGRLADSTGSILFGMMAMSAFLSMWISNTATVAMMLPLGVGVLSLVGVRAGASRYGTALMLGIAWAASIGGVATVIGTPPNGIALGILNVALPHQPITFLGWMTFGVPIALLLLPAAWFILMRLHPPEVAALPGGRARLQEERAALGPLTGGEKGTIAVFLLAVTLWLTNPFWPALLPAAVCSRLAWLDEYLIGLLCGTLLFFLPVSLRRGEFLLSWSDTKCVDWGTLLLFGGGIALSDAMFKTGLASWIATAFVGRLGSPSPAVLVAGVVLLIILLTEVTSNTAVTSMMVPVVMSIAMETGANPLLVAVATAVGASMAFMLPVATPPNALVYGTGFIRLKDMVCTGCVLDAVGWLLTLFMLLVVADHLWGAFG